MVNIGSLPRIRFNRSKHPLNYSHKTAFNEGDLVPIYIQEVYPGDNHKVDTTFVIRTSNPFIRPVMDNVFMDLHFFFVPNRLVFDKWKEFMGENTESYWTQNEDIEIPQTYSNDGNSGNVPIGSIADYFGLNNGIIDDDELSVSMLPFRAFALIYNDWFRDENLIEPVFIQKGAFNSNEVINGNAFGPNNYTGLVPKACKLRDYFTSCLPEPQKGEAVGIPISGILPVGPVVNNWPSDVYGAFLNSSGNSNPLNVLWNANDGLVNDRFLMTSSNGSLAVGAQDNSQYVGSVHFGNLGADASSINGTINDLRFAVQLQKYLETDAVYGTRYIEYLYGHFGVTSSDKTQQRPQYLGGRRTILNLTQVTQTSQSTDDSPLAQVSAYSLTNGRQGFNSAFEEHGFIIGVACVRHMHTYQQGNPKFFTSRQHKLDFYDPLFAHLGEQPVYTKELYTNTAEISGDEIFGYNQAFADMRCRNSIVTGALKTSANNGLDVWHMADVYNSRPYLNGSWIKETGAYFDRCLSLPSSSLPNFIADFYFKNEAIRVIPVYSTPGLMDHKF